MKRFIRALRTIPKRVLWILGGPLIFLVLFAIDRHTATVAFMALVAHETYRRIVETRQKSQAAGEKDCEDTRDEHIWINPSTGLPMVGNSIAGFDIDGYYWGEDP